MARRAFGEDEDEELSEDEELWAILGVLSVPVSGRATEGEAADWSRAQVWSSVGAV